MLSLPKGSEALFSSSVVSASAFTWSRRRLNSWLETSIPSYPRRISQPIKPMMTMESATSRTSSAHFREVSSTTSELPAWSASGDYYLAPRRFGSLPFPERGSPLLFAPLSSVDDRADFDFFTLDAVDHNEGRASNHQLA